MPKPTAKNATKETIALARKAAAYLKDHNQDELAKAVTALVSAAPTWARQGGDAISMWLPVDVKQRLQEAIDSGTTSIKQEVLNGVDAYLSGEWIPSRPHHRRGAGAEKVSASTRVPDEVVWQVEAHAETYADQLALAGWSALKPPSVRQLGEMWLTKQFSDQPGDKTAEESLRHQTLRAVREASPEGLTMQQLVALLEEQNPEVELPAERQVWKWLREAERVKVTKGYRYVWVDDPDGPAE